MSGPPLSCMSQAVWPWEQYKPDVHPLAQPDLDYFAPESVWSQVNDAASDMYSLGVVITTLYNDGQPLFSSNNDWLTHKRNINEVLDRNLLTFIVVIKTVCYHRIHKLHQPKLGVITVERGDDMISLEPW